MEIRLELPDYFQSAVKARTSAELSTMLQMILLNPTLLNTTKGLEVDSVLTLEYLSQILTAVQNIHLVSPKVVQPINVEAGQLVQPDIDIDLSVFSTPMTIEEDLDVDTALGDLANFLEG